MSLRITSASPFLQPRYGVTAISPLGLQRSQAALAASSNQGSYSAHWTPHHFLGHNSAQGAQQHKFTIIA
jgi:hypothetical protein